MIGNRDSLKAPKFGSAKARKGPRRHVLAFSALTAVWCLGLAGAGSAQEWPQRSVRFIVPLGPGSASDIGARLIAERLQSKWGKPVSIENRPGGDSLIGLGAFVTANDDHVLLYGASGTFTVHPYQHEKLPYDSNQDLQPIAKTTVTLVAVGVPASMDVKTLKDFVALAKAEPGKLNAAMPAGITEFVFDGFTHAEKLKIVKVPYRDVVQAATDVGEGRLQFIFTAIAILRPHVEGGRVKLLAVGTPKQTTLAPGIPSVVEAGVPSLELEGLNGLFGPKGMPLGLRRRIGADVITAVTAPEVVEKLAATGQIASAGGPDEFAQAMAAQVASVDGIAKSVGIARKLNK